MSLFRPDLLRWHTSGRNVSESATPLTKKPRRPGSPGARSEPKGPIPMTNNSTIVSVAAQIVEAAGQGGGADEVARLASDGWPANRPLDMGALDASDELELRAAIQTEAQRVAGKS